MKTLLILLLAAPAVFSQVPPIHQPLESSGTQVFLLHEGRYVSARLAPSIKLSLVTVNGITFYELSAGAATVQKQEIPRLTFERGITTATLSMNPAPGFAAAVEVYLAGVRQEAGWDYTVTFDWGNQRTLLVFVPGKGDLTLDPRRLVVYYQVLR
jgi:hypothetical protein